eukprot:1107886-Pyramimonas_sp.AAC.1
MPRSQRPWLLRAWGLEASAGGPSRVRSRASEKTVRARIGRMKPGRREVPKPIARRASAPTGGGPGPLCRHPGTFHDAPRAPRMAQRQGNRRAPKSP